jgi:hypothetical protein
MPLLVGRMSNLREEMDFAEVFCCVLVNYCDG